MQVLGLFLRPKIALNIHDEDVAVHFHRHFQRDGIDARLIDAEGISEAALEVAEVWRGEAEKVAGAEIDDRLESVRIILKVELEFIQPFGEVGAEKTRINTGLLWGIPRKTARYLAF